MRTALLLHMNKMRNLLYIPCTKLEYGSCVYVRICHSIVTADSGPG